MFKTYESLDTNTILRLMLGDIPEQREKVRILMRRPGIKYHISDLTITEAVYVLQGLKKSRVDIVNLLEQLFKSLSINANFNLFSQVFPMYLEHPNLSFNDCCLAAYAALNEAEPLWTFDQALAQQSPTAKLLA